MNRLLTKMLEELLVFWSCPLKIIGSVNFIETFDYTMLKGYALFYKIFNVKVQSKIYIVLECRRNRVKIKFLLSIL